jgi:wyosine [tRNA(Phe)-imidazoG37] synthetase (radical SAM superfamily)
MQTTDVNTVATQQSLAAPMLGTVCERKSRTTDPFGLKRDFLENHFVYLAISPRARGLSIGVNLNPDAHCTFGCLYCDVDRSVARPDSLIDCDIAARELEQTLRVVHHSGLKSLPPYNALPAELLRLRHVALSGDGEPTASPKFLEAVETIVHVRARGEFPFFKIVLITNASHLDVPEVQTGLNLFTMHDEVWAKLDVGTEAYMDRVNQSSVPIEKILQNILLTGRRRPVIIQSLFSVLDGQAPTVTEINEYAQRLKELETAGANIPLVQIYSATRPVHSKRIQHLPLRTMRQIADIVRNVAGLHAEVF